MIRPLILAVAALAVTGCSSSSRHTESQASAPNLMIQYGCPTCHVIPGVPGAVGKVGPPLGSLGQRSYVAGSLPNSQDDLILWLMHPQQIRPGTAMPEMGVTLSDARQMATFLESSP